MSKEIEFKREMKYIVIKRDDVEKYLVNDTALDWKALFKSCLGLITVGRKKDGKKDKLYVVVNQDEPYAEDIWMLIEHGKSLKELGYRKFTLRADVEKKILELSTLAYQGKCWRKAKGDNTCSFPSKQGVCEKCYAQELLSLLSPAKELTLAQRRSQKDEELTEFGQAWNRGYNIGLQAQLAHNKEERKG